MDNTFDVDQIRRALGVIRDFDVENHGTIFLLRPLTETAREWIEEHIPGDAMTFGDAVVVEHRYINDILTGLHADELTFAIVRAN